MINLRRLAITLSMVLLASAAYAGGDADENRTRHAYPVDASRTTPRENCPLTCKVLRISTRCECPIRQTMTSV